MDVKIPFVTNTVAPDIDIWKTADPGSLVAHIRQFYHQRHKQQLPELIQLSITVGGGGYLPEITEQLNIMQAELFTHMMKEELVLFPMLEGGRGYMAGGPITCMEMEHLEHMKMVEQLMRMTNGFSPQQGSSNECKLFYDQLCIFCKELIEHIHLENHVLFKHFTHAAGGGCSGSCACN